MPSFVEFEPRDLPIQDVTDILHLTSRSADSLYDALAQNPDINGDLNINGSDGLRVSQQIANALPRDLETAELMKTSVQTAREVGCVSIAGNIIFNYREREETA